MTAVAQTKATRPASTNQGSCLDAAASTVGARAVVLRCGDLNASGTLEAVVAVPLKPDRKDCVPVSRLLVLRRDPTGWKPAFEAGPHSEIKNTEGYVGVDYIDDSDLYPSSLLSKLGVVTKFGH